MRQFKTHTVDCGAVSFVSNGELMNGRNHNTGTGVPLNVNFMRLMNFDFIYLCVPIVLKQCLIEIEYHVSLILRHKVLYLSQLGVL